MWKEIGSKIIVRWWKFEDRKERHACPVERGSCELTMFYVDGLFVFRFLVRFFCVCVVEAMIDIEFINKNNIERKFSLTFFETSVASRARSMNRVPFQLSSSRYASMRGTPLRLIVPDLTTTCFATSVSFPRCWTWSWPMSRSIIPLARSWRLSPWIGPTMPLGTSSGSYIVDLHRFIVLRKSSADELLPLKHSMDRTLMSSAFLNVPAKSAWPLEQNEQ